MNTSKDTGLRELIAPSGHIYVVPNEDERDKTMAMLVRIAHETPHLSIRTAALEVLDRMLHPLVMKASAARADTTGGKGE